MQKERDKHEVLKVPELLEKHKADIMEELGKSAFDLLAPRQVAKELNDMDARRLPDLVRQGWLAPAPVPPIGTANLYYRWRVEFIKRYRRTYSKEKSA